MSKELLTLDRIKEITHSVVASKKGVRSVILFGSYAKKLANEDSDIDIIVDFFDVFEDDCYADVLKELESLTDRKVDLLELDGVLNSVYRDSLLEGGIHLYVRP